MAYMMTSLRSVLAPGLVVATHNPGKLREISDLLAPLGLSARAAGELGLAEPEETESTFIGNALLKARAACAASGLPALADDSGLAVAALGGDPGIYSARWAGPDKDFRVAMQRVWRELEGKKDHSARFVCVLALALPDGTEHAFEGEARGAITWPPRGDKGFGYDPIFVPEGQTRTFAEMNALEKLPLTHRARAFEKFLSALK
jgi:XTP/dITP diphosphohydrolase